MSCIKTRSFLFLLVLLPSLWISAQEDADRSAFLGIMGGLSSYQGDLQPNSFSFAQSGGWASVWVRKPISGHFSVKGGVAYGNLKAADANNRDYLKVRNLSFQTIVKEAFLDLEFALTNMDNNRIQPFLSGGVSVFHFNPYTHDGSGNKFYLQPLGTEGQGLPSRPGTKLYKRTQPALTFGGGIRYGISRNVMVSLTASQRKTFTDYLDDVSSSYADEDELLQARGPKAVELAYRGDELANGSAYPKGGEQRGTPTEMDWFYFAGVAVEIKLNAIGKVVGNLRAGNNDWYNKRCPPVNF